MPAAHLPTAVRETPAISAACVRLINRFGSEFTLLLDTPLEDLRIIRACARRAEVSVAGGISLDTVADYMALTPDVLIVGGAIAAAADPAAAARAFCEAIR